MRTTNLAVFYQLGASLTYITANVKIGDPIADLFMQLMLPTQSLVSFRSEAAELEDTYKDTCVAVDHFIKMLNDWYVSIPKDFNRKITEDEVKGIWFWKDKFEEAFEREQRNLSVFTVTPKGTRNTRILLAKPEADLPSNTLAKLPKQFTYDLAQAARCLVFDVPTACAFHLLRATESLMIAYYEALAQQKWPYLNKDWHQYITHLGKQNAEITIITRLWEIKEMERNPIVHPDTNVELEEAKVLYNLCAGVNHLMAVQIDKLTP